MRTFLALVGLAALSVLLLIHPRRDQILDDYWECGP